MAPGCRAKSRCAILAVVDGIIGGEGNGPMSPDAKPCGVILAGTHPAAVDMAAATLMGFDWQKLRLLKNSFEIRKRNFIPFRPSDISLVSNKPEWDGPLGQAGAVRVQAALWLGRRDRARAGKPGQAMSLEDKLYPLLSLYDRLPQGARNFIGAAYRRLPRRIRHGRAYGEFRELAEASPSWSESDLREYQLRELRRTLVNAASYCPFYSRSFAKAGFRPDAMMSLDDFAGCPSLTKQDMQQHFNDLTSTGIADSQKLYITTGGSTGVPVGFHLQKGVSRPKEQAFLEANWRRAGYFDKARLALIRGHVTDSRARGNIIAHDATRNWLMLSSYHLTDERIPEYLEALENFQPDFLNIYPSAALQLAEYLQRHDQRWRTPLQGVLCGSEQLTLSQKRLLEGVFQCRVLRWYGHAERVVLAAEGTYSDLFYFWPHYGFVEFGEPDGDGLREVIGTTFHNMAMPLVRYRTGDFVRLAKPDARDGNTPGLPLRRSPGAGRNFLSPARGGASR